jgi:two-component system sensor histidine kinase QseC
MNSIRVRLFAILLITTGALWLCASVWIYGSTQRHLERVLDARLAEAARMVSSLLTDHQIDPAAAAKAVHNSSDNDFEFSPSTYARQLSCQIWSLQGQLVGRSESAPATSLASHRSGFAETEIDGVPWRVFAVVNEKLGVRVLVGDSIAMRERLVSDMVKGLLLPAVTILPLLAVMIWLSVGRGLSPLDRLARVLSKRRDTELHPLPEGSVAKEITPMISALNGLFNRVAEARQRERDFTAYAAHELKTPLAGLKTQAQIAIMAQDRAIQEKALGQIVNSVDRTSRMVRQLIDMAAVDTSEEGQEKERVDVDRLVREIALELEPKAESRNVSVDCTHAASGSILDTDRILLRLAIRNVLENAIQHTLPQTVITAATRCIDEEVSILVTDRGPGIPPEEHRRVTERFYRSASVASGSGLGLSIVDMAVQRLRGSLSFSNEHAFTVTLSFPLKSGTISAENSTRAYLGDHAVTPK